MKVDAIRLRAALDHLRQEVLGHQHAGGYWEGRSPSSPLATAAAVSALATYRGWDVSGQKTVEDAAGLTARICRGLQWLADRQNPDGGWGEIDSGPSTLAATMLAAAAFQLTGIPADHPDLMERAEDYLRRAGGIRAFHRQYGRDRTFAAPVLANCALAEMVPWGEVMLRGMWLAARRGTFCGGPTGDLPSSRHPGLLAARLGHTAHRGARAWPVRPFFARRSLSGPLEAIAAAQSASGGFFGAIAVTSFVVMNLTAAGGTGEPSGAVIRDAVGFLRRMARPDGSWPAEVNQSVWATSLSLRALCAGNVGMEADRVGSLDWLLESQHRQPHPLVDGPPGGWARTDLPGGIPQVEATAAVLLALRYWYDLPGLADEKTQRIHEAAVSGVQWLLDQQNARGEWPACCRGRGASDPDGCGLERTAHALQALAAWPEACEPAARARSAQQALGYLQNAQREGGYWGRDGGDSPGASPLIRTARVLWAYRDWQRLDDPVARQALGWLLAQQHRDGSWGPARSTGPRQGRPTGRVEETAAVVEAAVAWSPEASVAQAVASGVNWLLGAIEREASGGASPVGFSRAHLWYDGRVYPLSLAASALARAADALTPTSAHPSLSS